MIAKALVQECPLIILDEPTAFLDVVSRIEIMTLLHQLAVEQNKAILLSTHDIEQALVLSDKLWLLSKETGLQCGVTEDMILNHRMDTLFSHSNIRFDYNHGIYYPTVTGKKRNQGGSRKRYVAALDHQRLKPTRLYLPAGKPREPVPTLSASTLRPPVDTHAKRRNAYIFFL